jgi:hypothetical protein
MGFQGGNDLGDDVGVLVGDFGIIYIPADGTLRTINVAIGNALVVGVKCETHSFEGGTEEFVPEEGGLDASVESLDAANIENLDAIFNDNERSVSGVNFTEEANGVAGKFHKNVVFHVCFEVGPSNVSTRDVP